MCNTESILNFLKIQISDNFKIIFLDDSFNEFKKKSMFIFQKYRETTIKISYLMTLKLINKILACNLIWQRISNPE